MNDLAQITRSLEQLSDTGVDMTPQVYQRFFTLCPEAEAMFASTEARSVQGKMINELVQTVLDQLEEKPYSQTVMETMVDDHDSWGVSLPMYEAFLQAFLEVLQETLVETMDDDMQAAWQRQFERILRQVVTVLPQR